MCIGLFCYYFIIIILLLFCTTWIVLDRQLPRHYNWCRPLLLWLHPWLDGVTSQSFRPPNNYKIFKTLKPKVNNINIKHPLSHIINIFFSLFTPFSLVYVSTTLLRSATERSHFQTHPCYRCALQSRHFKTHIIVYWIHAAPASASPSPKRSQTDTRSNGQPRSLHRKFYLRPLTISNSTAPSSQFFSTEEPQFNASIYFVHPRVPSPW